MENSTFLDSKPRYMVLDGLRGVAALIVVAFHLFETYSGGHIHQIINHGYLAVDFFFVLSGFVIGYAYDDRWSKMNLITFFKRRLIRLHPMLIIGSVLGGLLYYFGSCIQFPIISQTPWWKVLIVMILGCCLIPTRGCLDIRGWAEGYPLNGPAWTLMFEYIANILYATVIRRLGKTALMICVAIFAVMTILLTMNIDIFGFLSQRSDLAYTVIGGWSIDPHQLYVGFSRLLYPFFAGLLLSRLGYIIKVRNGFVWCSVFIAIILLMPFVGTEDIQWTNGLYEAICILILFPLIVSIGAGTNEMGKKTFAVCKFLGNTSFPIYITHYPLIYIQMSWAFSHPDAPAATHAMVSISIFLISVALAYAAFRLYDLPVRSWLKKAFLK
ncbi:MAG: acyltransferase family protein [Muribaculaceae bacterium]